MFKLIHTSDHHHGLTTYGVDDVSGINTRSQDSFKIFDEVIDYAVDNNVKLIVNSGDFFNTKSVSQNIVYAAYQRIKRISDAGIDFYLLQGNHDSSMVLFNKNGLDLANIFNLPHIYVTRGNGPIVDLGYAQLCSVSYWSTSEEIEAQIALYAQKLDWTRPAFLVCHLQVEFANFPGSFKEDLHFTPLSLLTSHHWTGVYLGHIHQYQQLNENPPVYYAGSLVRTSFAEEKEKKAFSVYTIDGTKITSIHRQPVDCLKMLTLRGDMTYLRKGLSKTVPENFENTIIRCIVDETEEVIDEKFLKTAFSKAFKLILTKEKAKTEVARMERGKNLTNIQDALKLFFNQEPNLNDLMDLVNELRNESESKIER